MRFLPVFLDLRTGPVVLVGNGELAQARLRLLSQAGARVRWYVTRDAEAVEPARTVSSGDVEIASGDPLTDSLDGVIAVLGAGAGEVGVAIAARARAAGIPVNVMDDLQ